MHAEHCWSSTARGFFGMAPAALHGEWPPPYEAIPPSRGRGSRRPLDCPVAILIGAAALVFTYLALQCGPHPIRLLLPLDRPSHTVPTRTGPSGWLRHSRIALRTTVQENVPDAPAVTPVAPPRQATKRVVVALHACPPASLAVSYGVFFGPKDPRNEAACVAVDDDVVTERAQLKAVLWLLQDMAADGPVPSGNSSAGVPLRVLEVRTTSATLAAVGPSLRVQRGPSSVLGSSNADVWLRIMNFLTEHPHLRLFWKLSSPSALGTVSARALARSIQPTAYSTGLPPLARTAEPRAIHHHQ